MTEVVGLVAGTGVASGLSLYATTLLLGLYGRWVEPGAVPELLTDGPLLWVAMGLTVVELVADKVPWLDSAWDLVHTVVRPVGAALLGVVLLDAGLLPDGAAGLSAIGAGALSGGLALTTHAGKATTRAAVNTSPEPFSNVLVSLVEDGVVVGLVALAVAYPLAAAIVAGVVAVTAIGLTLLLLRYVGRVRQRLRDRRRSTVARRSI